MQISKNTIVVLIVLAALAVGYYLYSKKDTLPTAPPSPFTTDDETTYNAIRSATGDGINSWMDKIVVARYNQKKPEDMIKGQVSKTLVYTAVLSMSRPNDKGEFVDRDGTRVLTSQESWDNLWRDYIIPFKGRNSGI